MNIRSMKIIAYVGIVLVLFLSVWYWLKTYNAGNPSWIYLIMAFGIAILLAQNLGVRGRKKS